MADQQIAENNGEHGKPEVLFFNLNLSLWGAFATTAERKEQKKQIQEVFNDLKQCF